MDSMNYFKKEIPVTKEYDVVIVGGGTSGAVAAVSCGRQGLDTLIVEQYGALGGSQTLAMVSPVMPSRVPNDAICSAIHSEIVNRMVNDGQATPSGPDNGSWFNPVMLQIVLEQMVAEAGCKVLYHTVLIDAIKEENNIKAVIVHNKSGLRAIRAKRFIDCSGDADLAYLADVPTDSGDANHVNQAISLRFEMSNVDVEKFGRHLKDCGQIAECEVPMVSTDCSHAPKFKEFILQKHAEGMLTDLDVSHFQMFSIPGRPHDVNFNCPELGTQVNVIDAEFMSQKQMEGKIGVLRISNFVKKYVPGFENAYLCAIAPMLGIRESRRIQAVYQFTYEDVFGYRKFADGIATSNYPLDVHGNKGHMRATYIDVGEAERYYEIPYRSLVPIAVNNLIVAGRCIGVDFYAQSTIRVQHTCRAMGEAAGIAAYLSLQKGVSFADLDGSEVRNIMIERGAQF